MNLVVERAGFLTTVQDRGRAGFRDQGVAVGGALDTHALRVANAFAGNDDDAAGVEFTLGTARLRFTDERLIAWCGAQFNVRLGDDAVPAGRTTRVAAGETLTIEAPAVPSRAWLAVSGGIDVPTVMESRATDLRGRFGGLDGRALRDGDVLPLNEEPAACRSLRAVLRDRRFGTFTVDRDWIGHAGSVHLVRVMRGVDWQRFSEGTRNAFFESAFTVSPASDRMGARLSAAIKLERSVHEELVSEPVAPGTIQVPPDGDPILLLNDCQTLGGYPKIAHVIAVDMSIAAQLRPGDSVQFREVTLAAAHAAWMERETDLARFRVGLSLLPR